MRRRPRRERSPRRPGQFDTLVVNVGYNDFSSTFAAGFDAVVAAARCRGIARIVWLTYRESVGYQSPQGASNPENYATYNAMLRSFVAERSVPGRRARRLERLHRHAS